MIKVTRTHLEPAYRQVNSEEGAYDAHVGWNIIAIDTHGNYWLYVGKKETPEADYNPPVCFRDDTIAQTYADRIGQEGLNEKYWWCFHAPSPYLPDYVTNYWRPEYN